MALACSLAAGAATAWLFELRFPPNHVQHLRELGVDLSGPVQLEGFLVSAPRHTPYGVQFDMEVRRLESRRRSYPLCGKVRLRVEGSESSEATAASPHLDYGDFIRAVARLRKPRIYRNPGSFNFRRWMENFENVYWVGTIKSPLLIEKLASRQGWNITAFTTNIRQRLVGSIDGLYPPWSAEARNGAVLKAALLGDRSSLDSDTIESFRKTGLYHLLVVAGLHVGLLAALAWFLLRLSPLGNSWRLALLLLFLACYALIVEQRAPTLRAVLMISAGLLAKFFYRRPATLNAIGLAALVLLYHRPAWLFESGFQMSFAAALLIVTLVAPILERTTEPYRHALWQLDAEDLDGSLMPRTAQFRLDLRAFIRTLEERLSFFQKHPALATRAVTVPTMVGLWTAEMILFSMILQLGLLLPLAAAFHRVTFVGIGMNALAIPVMTLLLGLAVPTVILGALVPWLAIWPGRLLALVLHGLFALTTLPRLPLWLSYRVPGPPRWVAWGFVLSVIAAAWALGRRPALFWISLGTFGFFAALIALYPFGPEIPRGAMEVTALDCGAGDALFLVLPDQTTLLIDAGGSRSVSTGEGTFQGRRGDPGEDIVSPYLWSRGLKKIDIVALSHAHEDHLGGFFAVVRNFRVGEFWHGANPLTPAYQLLLEQIAARGILMRNLDAGSRIERGTTSLSIIWPPSTLFRSSQPRNDESLVLRVSDGEASVLLPGDISAVVEEELLGSGTSLESRVLKVAHHGSKSSSSADFLARVSPRVALISVESGNFRNLPNLETLARLRATGAQIFRTDLDGASTVEMRRGSLIIHTYGKAAD